VRGEELIPPGFVWAPFNNANMLSFFIRGEITAKGLELMWRECMQDYEALGYPDLLDRSVDILRVEIAIRQKNLLNNHCS